MNVWRILQGDVCERLASLPAESVQTCVTSPPYWGLRDYGTATWDGGDPSCDHDQRRRENDGNSKSATSAGQTRDSVAGRTTCRKCGARRIDAQIGLEPTPSAYVTRMVEVFAEVHRVLRDDGTLWLNLGASYASAPVETFKHKDLVSIPAMVAEALRAPRYTGRIKSDRDRLWLAAMVDTEGCIRVHRRRAGTSAHSTYTKRDGTVSEYVRKADTYGVMVSVDNTSRALIDRCAEVAGVGSLYTHEANTGQSQRKQTLHRWTVTGGQARELLRELYPDLIAKRQQARIAYHSPSNGDAAAEAHAAIKSLHAGVGVTLDAPEPPSLFVPGWYLRSEIIWGKPNPMPESVTDRPTKSHEQIFLFSKSARYYYDAEAIKEAASDTGGNGSFSGRQGGARSTAISGGIGTDQMHPYGGTRNKRSVWTVATQPYPEAHFATYPEALIEPCILAGSKVGDLVLDPFTGSGTTGAVAIRHQRSFVGTELNPAYIDLARKRIGSVAPMFARECGEELVDVLARQA